MFRIRLIHLLRSVFSIVLLPLSFGMMPVLGQETIYDNSIRTWTQTLSGWDMESNQIMNTWIQLPAEIKNNQILGLQVLVFSDEAVPEVFNLTRQGGKRESHGSGKGKSGGRSSFYAYDQGKLFVEFDRGDCELDANGNCKTGSDSRSGFFGTGKHNGATHQTFPVRTQRAFYDVNKTRLVLKIEYFCNSCAATSTNRFWMKLGAWDMANGRDKAFPPGTFQIQPAKIIDMNATIYSDLNASSKIQVDNLEHLGTRGFGDYARGRGGILWYGYGQVVFPGYFGSAPVHYTDPALRLFRGPITVGTGSFPQIVSNYRGSSFNKNGSDIPLEYKNTAITKNRGWVMIEYTGAKSAIPVPYAFLRRAHKIGDWDMETDEGGGSITNKYIPFSNFGISANRIGRISTTIHSDPSACLPLCQSGIEVTNFHRTHYSGGGVQKPAPMVTDVGGLTFVDESVGPSGSMVLQLFGNYPVQGFYNKRWYSRYSNTAINRGYVLIDYLAGSCEQGPSGFKIQAVPGTNVGDCTGSAQPFVIEGAGRGTLNGTTTDSLTYVYKQITTNGTNRTVTVKVVSQDAANTDIYGLAGVMFRASLAPSSPNASMVATRTSDGGGLYFRRRGDPLNNVPRPTVVDQKREPGSVFKSPCWVRVQKAGNTFRAYYNTSTSETMPPSGPGWVKLGPDQTINMGASYYIGLMVSNLTSPNLSKVQFRGLTETIP